MRGLFSTYRAILATKGAAAVMSAETRLAGDGRADLYYIPFEHVNRDARLVIVGITPGPTQLELAYSEAQALIKQGVGDEEVLRQVIRHAGFGGSTMRPNLLRMLRHFRIRDLLGIDDEEQLFGDRSDLLHSTSTVPHAAFRDGKMFAGQFTEVLNTAPYADSFRRDFVASLSLLRPDALFVALGPTPLAALELCAAEGCIRADQIIGAFAHPSTSAGSQVDIYLGYRRVEDLKPNDPVRSRAPWLVSAYERTRSSVERLLESGLPPVPLPAPVVVASTKPLATAKPKPSAASAPAPKAALQGAPSGIYAVVKRGAGAGAILTPHVHDDGMYVVSPTRYETDYVRVPDLRSVAEWVAKGYRLRMSAPGRAASLISSRSIVGL